MMTIILTPATEARRRKEAKRDGQDVNALMNALLAEALTADPDELSDEEVPEVRAGIRRGLDAVNAGRERLLTDYAAEVQARTCGDLQAVGRATG